MIFVVECAAEGGFSARALGASIFTEGADLDQLRENVRAAVRCHFDGAAPGVVWLQFVHDEVLVV